MVNVVKYTNPMDPIGNIHYRRLPHRSRSTSRISDSGRDPKHDSKQLQEDIGKT